MGDGHPSAAVIKHAPSVEFEPVGAADGLQKGVLLDERDGAPTMAMRRFLLDPGASVPKHTNEIEHEQYVLAGRYIVGIGEAEHEVGPGDCLLIPAETVHWYRNEGPEQGQFLCMVPLGDDEIQVLE